MSGGGALAEQGYARLRAGNRKDAAALLARAIDGAPNDPRAAAWRTDRRLLLRRWSADAYVLARRGSAPPLLGATPTLGGSQLGARLAYVLNPLSNQRIALSGRVFQPLSKRSDRASASQAVLGLELQPVRFVPVTVALDRYIAAGSHARDAWAVRVSGGADSIVVRPGLTASLYGQAGIIGAKSRDGYADGWAKLQASAIDRAGMHLFMGAGLWAGVQPGASRVDAGPTAELSGKIGSTRVVATVDYRFRAGGNARPGSGPALTVRAGF